MFLSHHAMSCVCSRGEGGQVSISKKGKGGVSLTLEPNSSRDLSRRVIMKEEEMGKGAKGRARCDVSTRARQI